MIFMTRLRSQYHETLQLNYKSILFSKPEKMLRDVYLDV